MQQTEEAFARPSIDCCAAWARADLVAAGYLKPGRNKVAVAYKGERVTATLTKEGIIIWQGDPHE